MPGKTFTAEFKRDALALAARDGVPKTAESLGVEKSNLYRWQREARQAGDEAFRGRGVPTDEHAEILRLKREIASLQEDKEILKKALTIFSQKR
jgi:transposase